jgi:hypothetical protein
VVAAALLKQVAVEVVCRGVGRLLKTLALLLLAVVLVLRATVDTVVMETLLLEVEELAAIIVVRF